MSKIGKTKILLQKFLKIITSCEGTLFGPKTPNSLHFSSSFFFEMPINYFAYPLMLKRENDNSFIGAVQSLIPLDYYNNV